MPRTIRVPRFTDLSDQRQANALVTVLRQIQNDAQRSRLPIEAVRGRQDRNVAPRFRAVSNQKAVPGDANFGENEVHFKVGGRWRRVVLEDL